MTDLQRLQNEVIRCTKCPRLVRWRTRVAREKVKRFEEWDYWGKPVPGFGDPAARLVLVGLAPAAHGANRTGRMFTGDRSGDWLYRALHKAGFANQPDSLSSKDGLRLNDCYITATCRCAPPLNKVLPAEVQNCRPFLLREFQLLKNMTVVIGLGRIGFEAAARALKELGKNSLEKKPRFFHGAEYDLDSGMTLLATFHPSQQNTFTGKLTEPMFDSVFRRARTIVKQHF